MPSGKKYSFDASSLIDIAKHRYPEATFPMVKARFDEIASEGRISIFDVIFEELQGSAETDYYDSLKGRMLVRISELSEEEIAQIQEEVQGILTRHPYLFDASQSKSGGDVWLIAYAKVMKEVVVTEERKTSTKKIPYVCGIEGVECMCLFDFFVTEGWVF